MAPKPPVSRKGSSKASKGNHSSSKSSSKSPSSKTRKPKSLGKRPPPQQIKTKPGVHNPPKPKKKNQRLYTDKELDLPTLNMITPAGVQKPAWGKKKGKVFVDDREGMMTILAMVNAEKEGAIESKVLKARRLEEVREARRVQAEARKVGRAEVLEGVKTHLKRERRGGKGNEKGEGGSIEVVDGSMTNKKAKKRVSFREDDAAKFQGSIFHGRSYFRNRRNKEL